MANKVFNMAGGKHSAAAYSAFENAMYGSCVASDSDFVATAGTGMNVSLSKGNGLIDTGLEYARRIQSDATQTIAVSAASSANPRKDAIVAYIDNSVTPSTSYTDNTNNILKFKSVDGTPAATPSAPSAATIQTSVGAGNPYVVLWHVLVPKSATSLTAATFTRACRVANKISTTDLNDGAVTMSKIDFSTMTIQSGSTSTMTLAAGHWLIFASVDVATDVASGSFATTVSWLGLSQSFNGYRTSGQNRPSDSLTFIAEKTISVSTTYACSITNDSATINQANWLAVKLG